MKIYKQDGTLVGEWGSVQEALDSITQKDGELSIMYEHMTDQELSNEMISLQQWDRRRDSIMPDDELQARMADIRRIQAFRSARYSDGAAPSGCWVVLAVGVLMVAVIAGLAVRLW